MKKSLFDKKTDSQSPEELEKIINQYSKKDKSELFSDLKTITENEKKNGNLSDAQLEEVSKNLMPMLNPSQQRKLKDILSQIKG